jgi:predicted AlkP superfamily phosphohydrolase/phosphomutase
MEDFPKHPKEITNLIEPPLEIDDYGFTLISGGDINTTLIDHSSTTNVAQQWALLAKQWEFIKIINYHNFDFFCTF